MYISKLEIRNFRKSTVEKPLIVDFKKGVNILIGPNNIGKSTIVDALSLCLDYASPERYVWLNRNDFNDESKIIEIKLEFSGLSYEQETAFLQALVVDKKILKFTFKFKLLDEKIAPPEISAGEKETTTDVFEMLGYMESMYLGALRDTKKELSPGQRNRFGKIVRTNSTDIYKERVESYYNKANKDTLEAEGDNPIRDLETKTNNSLTSLSVYGDENKVTLKPASPDYNVLVSNLDVQVNNRDIQKNGLGWNNLIYISSVISQINSESLRQKHRFNCLIIEEPEAHLEPQLQIALLSFLQKHFSNLQIILTSHSPTLTSEANIKNLGIIVEDDSKTQGYLLNSLGILPRNRTLLRRYLDVTRSQLFFSKKIIFVEGITESILIRAFWNLENVTSDFSRSGAEIVNIQGVSFSPYLDLVRNLFSKTGTKCAFVTDDDRGVREGKYIDKGTFDVNDKTDLIVKAFDSARLSNRYIKLRTKIERLNLDNIRLFASRKTFEFEFGYANKKNIDKLKPFLSERNIYNKNLKNLDQTSFGIELWKSISRKNLKADFAQFIVNQIEGGNKIYTPDYIKKAIEFLS